MTTPNAMLTELLTFTVVATRADYTWHRTGHSPDENYARQTSDAANTCESKLRALLADGP